MSSISTASIQHLLRTIKADEQENIQDAREKSNAHFDEQIVAMKDQAATLNKMASNTGNFGWMNFAFNMFSTVSTTVTSLMSKVAEGLTAGLTLIQNILKSVQGLLESLHQKAQKTLETQQKQLEIKATTQAQFADNYETEEKRAYERSREVQQTLVQAQREIIESQEAMIRKV